MRYVIFFTMVIDEPNGVYELEPYGVFDSLKAAADAVMELNPEGDTEDTYWTVEEFPANRALGKYEHHKTYYRTEIESLFKK